MKIITLLSLLKISNAAVINGHERGDSCGMGKTCLHPGDCCGLAVED